MSRVWWRVSGDDPSPAAGDLLVRTLVDGQDAGPGWTVPRGGGLAYRYATVQDGGVTGVLVVPPPGVPDAVSSRAAPASSGMAELADLTAPVDAVPVVTVHRDSPVAFCCPWCGATGRYAGGGPDAVAVRLARPSRDQALATGAHEIVFGCFALRPHVRKWRLVVVDG